MSGPRELVFLEHPDDLETEAARESFASAVADHVVAMVNDARRRAGKPPLDKE